jgi:PAS domain S-box-containing protein
VQAQLKHALLASQQSEAESRAREARLQTSLEAANVGTWDWNIRTGEVRWSDNLERIHGQAQGGFRGTFEGFLEGVHTDDRQRVLDAIHRAKTAGEPYVVEYRSLVQGENVWFEGRGHVICDDAGEPAWMSGICMDVTERHRFQEQLCHTQRWESLGLLAGGIAHDFNNLLAAIMGNASLARDTLPAASPASPMLERVLTASERAALLTRRLLAYAGKDYSIAVPTDLGALVRELGSLLYTSIPRLISLSLEVDEDLPPVLIDEAQLQQVVMNLVINAAEAIPERVTGTVTVSTRRRQLLPEDETCAVIPVVNVAREYVELSVRDTGCGMDPATQARIFDPFYTTKFTGRGLGLAAVLGIVGAHGGTITLKSAPGQGSCFTILLPAAANGSSKPKSARTVHQMGRGSGTVLVVDDEPSVCQMARAALESNGYQVLLAGDGLAAIRQVAEHPEIRAILLDLTMPRMGGDIAASHVRALRPELPILLSSGYSEREAARSFTESGRAAFLQKPYTTTRLLETLGRLLDR